jgi:DNA-binding response OmpR family regulator
MNETGPPAEPIREDAPGAADVSAGSPEAGPAAGLPRILIVEDDVPLGKFLSRTLTQKQFSVEVCLNGESAWEALQASAFQLVILDLNLPGMDGISLLKRVRADLAGPRMLVLTARNRTEDLVSVLEHGADDYLIKPFSFLELLARVRGLLRREPARQSSATRVGDLVINREEHRVTRGARRVDLTPREFAILVYLMDNAGKTISRSTLMNEVWNVPFDPTTNIVDVYMKYLRDKIDVEGEEKLIHTVRGVGYVLRND